MNKYFIATYTNKVKDYCDEKFFKKIKELKGDNYVGVVDNTIGNDYFKRLVRMVPGNIYKVNVPAEPKRTQFLRNVAESVSALREDFLQRDEDYFLIIESDVIPPKDLLQHFDNAIEQLNCLDAVSKIAVDGENEKIIKPWGAIAAIYYKGFHNYDLTGLQPTHHCLSGCTVYKREAVEKYPFRWSEENLDAFPDAFWSHDAGQEYSLWNDHTIHCEHVHAANGTRQSMVL